MMKALPTPDRADVINLVGGSQGPLTFYVGWEVKMHSPNSIVAVDNSVALALPLDVEMLTLSYTTHSELVTINKKKVWMPCGLNLFSLHNGTEMLCAPLIITGNHAHGAVSFPVLKRRVSTLYLGLQTMGYGTFEVQINGQARG